MATGWPTRATAAENAGVLHLGERLAGIPGVVAVTLGGSRATGAADDNSDWDFGLYYEDNIDPADVEALGFPGQVFAPGAWGRIVNGGAWLTIDGTKVDLIYRKLGHVAYWVAEAEEGRFEIQREVGYVAGIATYVLAGELAVARVLAGALPRPTFPSALREAAPPRWYRLAAGAMVFAEAHARRGDRVGCLANVSQAVLATAQGRLAAAGEWALNEKRIVGRAGLDACAATVAAPHADLVRMVADVRRILALPTAGGWCPRVQFGGRPPRGGGQRGLLRLRGTVGRRSA